MAGTEAFSLNMDDGGAELHLYVTENGFEPGRIRVPRDEKITLVVLRKTEDTCAREIIIPQLGVHKSLPLGEPVRITFTARASGPIRYGCASNRDVSGVISVV